MFLKTQVEFSWTSSTTILKSLALASKVNSLALKPQVLENCPVLGSRTALLFESLKFCRSPKKNFCRPFLLIYGEHLRLCPWPSPRAFLSLTSRGSVLKRAVLGLGLGFFRVLGLEPSVLDSSSA